MTERQEKLLVELEKEYERLPEYNMGGGNNHREQYPLVFEYLKTGKVPDKIDDDHELLYAVVGDFDCLCSDYGVE